MFRPMIAAVVVAVALYACSKKEEPQPDQTQSKPATTAENPADTNPPKTSAANSQKSIKRAQSASAKTEDSSKSGEQAKASESDRPTTPDTYPSAGNAQTDSTTPSTPAKQKPKKKVARASSNTQGAPQDAASRWTEFQAFVARCETLTGDKRDRCLDDAKDAYRAAGLKCEALSDLDSKECMKYVEQWNGGGDKQAITHTEAPAITPASPGDPTPAQRNRDSTIQQLDAAGTLHQSTRKD